MRTIKSVPLYDEDSAYVRKALARVNELLISGPEWKDSPLFDGILSSPLTYGLRIYATTGYDPTIDAVLVRKTCLKRIRELTVQNEQMVAYSWRCRAAAEDAMARNVRSGRDPLDSRVKRYEKAVELAQESVKILDEVLVKLCKLNEFAQKTIKKGTS